ncbi:MAG: 2-oxoglutarate dehydrogenase, E2 component, dihydrolipoamide succinyltransferase [Actinomycetota bacterium]
MAEGRRRRRGSPPEAAQPRRRRRGQGPEPGPRRRRRRGRDDRDEAPAQGAAEDSRAGEAEPASGAAAEADAPAPERSTPVATEVTLPQLGESVTEGTITAWLVEVGDAVEADQPLFELSSDKIDTEVPAPTAGVVTEIKYGVDETVDVGSVVAVIGDAAEAPAGGTGDDAAAAQEPGEPAPAAEPAPQAPAAEPAPQAPAAEPAPQAPAAEPAQAKPSGEAVTDDTLMSPIVRRLVREHDLDVASLSGSGQGGRITREDVEAAIAAKGEQPAPATPAPQPAAAPREEPAPQPTAAPREEPAPQPAATAPRPSGARERVEDLPRIRKRIAQRMMESIQSSAQLTTVQEADVSRIMALRAQHRETFKAREGASLSPFAFLARAAVLALKRHPTVNAQADWQAGKVTYHEYVNLGIAVDTDKGLLVPNIKGADDLTLPALARGIAEVAGKARGKGTLEMQDIEGGTFTVTNTGSRGVLLDTPILNYPEVAILATGAIKKRPVVVEDDTGPSIAVRDMVYLCLTYDHQLLDGADAARFVTDVAEVVETHDWAGELGY